MKLYVEVNRELSKEVLKEGFYECRHNGRIGYLSQREGNWYMQYHGVDSFLITGPGSRIFIAEVDPQEVLKFLDQERKFVESKLAELAEKAEGSGLEVASESKDVIVELDMGGSENKIVKLDM